MAKIGYSLAGDRWQLSLLSDATKSFDSSLAGENRKIEVTRSLGTN